MGLNVRRVILHLSLAGTLTLAGCSASSLLAAFTPAGGGERLESIAYGPDARQRLDIYRPADSWPLVPADAGGRMTPPADAAELAKPAAGAGSPVVVFLYGGSWNRGDREDYRFVGKALAARGIVAVVADYRLYPQVRYPEFLRDSARAVAWTVREIGRYGGDAKRLFIMGHSAGGYNAAMMALDSRWLREENLSPSMFAGWIGLAGPYDFLPIRNPDVQPVFDHPNYPPGSQAIDYASPRSPRAFLAAGGSDDLVNPQRNTVQMADKLKAAGVPVTIRLYERANHVTLIGAFALPLRWLAPVLDDVAGFVLRR